MYKKYDQVVKDVIINTGNINAFPELKIPRTTALYWIRNSKTVIKSPNQRDQLLYKEITSLRNEVINYKAKFKYLKEILKISKCSYSKSQKELEICKKISNYKKYCSIKELCIISGISEKKYYQIFNKEEKVILEQTKPNQLTVNEQKQLINLSKDKSLSHLSIKQLQLYAFRNNILHCHYDTWRKYIINFNLRPNKTSLKLKKDTKTFKEFETNTWHIDITYFKGIDGSPLYLQVILDGYSRAIISWTLFHKRSKDLSLKTLSSALKKSKPKYLICDAGGENINFQVKGFLDQHDISRIIAHGDFRCINAKVEYFFNVLKNRYINKYKLYSLVELENLLDDCIYKYNNSPSTIFNGATPNEAFYKNIDSPYLKEELKTKQEYAKILRIKKYNEGRNHS